MGRSDQYMNCNELFQRFEIEGEPLTVKEWTTTTPYRGKDWPTRCIRWKGVHRIRHGDREYLAQHSVVFDSGPKLGVSVTVEEKREVPFTPEEIAAGRANIERVMMDLFGCVVIWPEDKREHHVEEIEKSPPVAV